MGIFRFQHPLWSALGGGPSSPTPWELAQLSAPWWGQGPYIIGGSGGSGTRVIARVLAQGGMFLGEDLNAAHDAQPMDAYLSRCIQFVMHHPTSNPAQTSDFESFRPLLEESLQSHLAPVLASPKPPAWGWKAPRSAFLLPILAKHFSTLRFIHVVRDGRDMAFTQNLNQLQQLQGGLLPPPASQWAEPKRLATLWQRINLDTAHYAEDHLPNRYLCIRLEDLCETPLEEIQRLFAFCHLQGATEQKVIEEIQTPTSLGRWKSEDPRTLEEVVEAAHAGLLKFGYLQA